MFELSRLLGPSHAAEKPQAKAKAPARSNNFNKLWPEAPSADHHNQRRPSAVSNPDSRHATRLSA